MRPAGSSTRSFRHSYVAARVSATNLAAPRAEFVLSLRNRVAAITGAAMGVLIVAANAGGPRCRGSRSRLLVSRSRRWP